MCSGALLLQEVCEGLKSARRTEGACRIQRLLFASLVKQGQTLPVLWGKGGKRAVACGIISGASGQGAGGSLGGTRCFCA